MTREKLTKANELQSKIEFAESCLEKCERMFDLERVFVFSENPNNPGKLPIPDEVKHTIGTIIEGHYAYRLKECVKEFEKL